MTYKKSRRGNADIDRVVSHVLQHSGEEYAIEEFSPYGYDERQYCSPGFNLPVGRLGRTPFGKYPEYHTSADNLDFVRPEYLLNSYSRYIEVVNILENNKIYINTNPKCEPQLGKRGLYGALGGEQDKKMSEMAMLWILNYSDGNHSLLDIAERSNIEFRVIHEVACRLQEADLLKS
jgi:aminopeptidase-like protein